MSATCPRCGEYWGSGDCCLIDTIAAVLSVEPTSYERELAHGVLTELAPILHTDCRTEPRCGGCDACLEMQFGAAGGSGSCVAERLSGFACGACEACYAANAALDGAS